MGQISFKRESFSAVYPEAKPLLALHHQEIAYYQDIPLAVDEAGYQALDEAGKLRVYTARNVDGKLVGYAAYIVGPNAHYMTSGVQAKQDVLFVHPDYRGGRVGLRFVDCIEDALRIDGVQVVYNHSKVKHQALARILEYRGHELVEVIHAKRLDRKD